MKKYIIITIILLAGTVQASTVHYSTQRKIVVPSLITGNGSVVRDVVLNYLTASSTVLSGSSSGTEAIDDVLYNEYTSATVRSFCSKLSAGGSSGGADSFPVTYGTQNPGVGTIDSNGDITYVGDGTTYFTATYLNRTRALPCTFTTNVGGTNYVFNSLVSGSLAQHIQDTIDTNITSLTPSITTQQLFSSKNAGTLTWVRNPDHFASTVDLTSIAVYTSSTGYQLTGALVAPDIMIHADHAYPSVGSTIYFVTSTSTTISRTVTSGQTVSGTDIRVTKLSSPITYGVTPAKVLATTTVEKYNIPATGNKITSTALNLAKVPVIYSPQDRGIYIGVTPAFHQNFAAVSESNGINYDAWYQSIVGGDSGTPAYFIINGEAVFIGGWWSPYIVSNISNYVSEINTIMTSLGSAYQLTTVDLSGFPTY